MGTLNVQLVIHPSGKVEAIDDNSWLYTPGMEGTLMENITKYVSVEFLTDAENNIKSDTLVFQEYRHNRDNMLSNSELPLFNDGVHYYYKLLIPKLEYLFVEAEGLFSAPHYEELYLANQTFFYDGGFYLYLGDNIILDRPMSEIEIMHEYGADILNNSKALNYIDIYENCGDQSFSCKKILFSICKLLKCFVSLQKEFINDVIYGKCVKSEELENKRNFLLSTIYVLDYLKDIGNYQEAQRIIENISDCQTSTWNCNCHG